MILSDKFSTDASCCRIAQMVSRNCCIAVRAFFPIFSKIGSPFFAACLAASELMMVSSAPRLSCKSRLMRSRSSCTPLSISAFNNSSRKAASLRSCACLSRCLLNIKKPPVSTIPSNPQSSTTQKVRLRTLNCSLARSFSFLAVSYLVCISAIWRLRFSL